ncbi:MAG: polymorphic outer membrane protein [Chloroflexi bacterium OLB15]|nr:MAG: polymorphic outer membrane protein [Chloroflexi bacterium OLB15]
MTFGCGDSFDHTFTADSSPRIPLSLSAREDAGIPVLPAALLTETDPFLLPVHILLPPDAPHTIVNYALFIQPTYLNIPSPDLSQEYITFQVSAPSTQTTTFTQTLTDAQTTHHLNIYFPDLSQAHWQNFTFRLTCAGIGTYAARWYINDVPHSCGSIAQHTMERIASHSEVGINVDVRLDSSENTAFALEYTLHIEPASPYVPIIPESDTVYYLSIELNEPTTFTHQLSSPEGDRNVRVEAAIFPMIGGQAAGRDFTFWLECNGPNAEITTASIEFQNWAYEPLWLLCFTPITQFIDESAGSPPRLSINVAMPDSLLPAFNQFTLHIIPAGEEMPFDSLPPTATPTSFNAVAITLAPPRPTATPFVIDLATAVIEAPTLRLISPDDGAIFNTQPITLMWTSLANISLYEIDIETCELQSGGCRNEQITTNNNSYTLSLSEDTPRLFTWKVRALLSDGTFTDYSAARTFTFMNTATPTTFGAIAITLAPPTPTATPTSFSAVAITLAPPTPTATPFIPSFPTATPVSGPGCPGPTAVDNGNALIGMIAGIGAANSNGKPDVINLDAGCTYAVTGPGSPLTINADGGNPLTINGNGATISGGGSVRVFRITSGATLNLNNVTIRDGRNGIYNHGGSVNISGGVITGNSRSFGGGIFNSGTMTIANSTIAGNTATSSGGGVFNIGTMTIINSTITGNTASNNGGGIANASSSIVNDGVVYQVSFGTMTITNSTIARNFAGIGGGLFHTTGPTVLSLQNSIASNNFGGDCVQITHSGPNLGCDGSVQGSALLGDFNGSYIPLLGGSAAIDAGDSSLCPTTDQIGNERNDGNGDGSVVCDLGAIEAQFTITTIPINAVQPILPTAPQDSSLLTATETSIPLRPSDTPMPIRPSDTSIPLRLSDTPIPIRPTNTSIPLRPSDTPIPIRPTNTSIPPRPSDTPIPIRPSDTPAPILPTDLPIAPIDRDFALLVRAGEAASLSDTISFPDGDTSDTISITVEGVGRDPINYTFTLNCTAVGTEFVQWAIMRGRGGLGCGQSITLTFSAEANQQVVQIFLPNNARRSYVNYTLAMTASS